MRTGLLIGACAIAVLAPAGATGSHPAQRPNRPPIRHQPIVPPHWLPHVAKAKRFAASRAGSVSFAVVDWWGRIRGLHIRRTVPSASVVKVMLMVAYLRRPSVRHRRLRPYDRALLRPMIRRSENGAASRVAYIVGSRVGRLARAAHMREFRFGGAWWGLSRISARDQARFLFRLERYIPRRHRRFALRQLAHVVPSQRWGIGRVKPRHWALYFKGGWGGGTGWVDHQVALLRHGQLHLSVAILTHYNPSHSYGMKTLRGVAARLLGGLERSVGKDRQPGR